MKFSDLYGDLSGTVYEGDMYIPDKGLTSLEGMPNVIIGSFNCNGNKLTSLEGMPNSIGGDFSCSANKLTLLEGMAKFIGGNFDCSFNDLISLEGMPNNIGGDFNCGGNNLISIIGIFDNVEGEITCDYGIYPYHMEARDYKKEHPNLSDIVFNVRMYQQTKCEYYLTQKEYEDYIEEHPEYAF